MELRTFKTSAAVLALSACVLTLAACDVRRDGEEDPAPEVEPVETAAPTPTPSASESEQQSILREDPEGVGIASPPEPLAVTIPFPDGAEIGDAAERLLIRALSSDAIDEDWPIVLKGHTDSAGYDEANLRSARARAEAVAAWLVEYGVDDDRIEIIAFGEQNPVAPNALPDGSPNEEGRRRNRRVEMTVAPPQPAPRATPSSRATSRATPSASATRRSSSRPE